MKFVANPNPKISLTLDGKAEITFTTHRNALQELELLKDKELIVEAKINAQKRSLSQNAYMWVLIGELSNKLGIGKDEVYRSYIKDYGQYEPLLIKNAAVDRFIHAWQSKGLGWVADVMREGKVEGCTVVLAYYGTSSYDRIQMNKILDAIIDDCKEQGISTLSESELALLKNEN